MVIESNHPYSSRTHNIVEIIPNDSIFEKRDEHDQRPIFSFSDDEDKPEDAGRRKKSSVSTKSNKGNINVRVTKNDIRCIVKMVDKLTDGHKRISFKNVSHAFNVSKKSNACKREFSEGRKVRRAIATAKTVATRTRLRTLLILSYQRLFLFSSL